MAACVIVIVIGLASCAQIASRANKMNQQIKPYGQNQCGGSVCVFVNGVTKLHELCISWLYSIPNRTNSRSVFFGDVLFILYIVKCVSHDKSTNIYILDSIMKPAIRQVRRKQTNELAPN